MDSGTRPAPHSPSASHLRTTRRPGFKRSPPVRSLLAGWGAHRVRLWQLARDLRAQFETRAADRARIAEELHDTLIQDLAALSLQAEIIDDQLPQEPDAAKHTLETLRARMQRVVSDGRRGMTELHLGVTGGDDLGGRPVAGRAGTSWSERTIVSRRRPGTAALAASSRRRRGVSHCA